MNKNFDMILFNNPQNIEVIKSFIDIFNTKINKDDNESTITICIINQEHQLFNAVAAENDPFATNTTMKPLIIAINEKVCQILDLTLQEQYAMIAHEIGHIIDNTPKEKNSKSREYNADQFAVKLGLSQELKTGLEKIIGSGNYLNESKDITERIKRLS